MGTTGDPASEDQATIHAPMPAAGRSASEDAQSTRYVILEAAGAGGMGTVHRAYDLKLRREVALKRLKPDLLVGDGPTRLIREAQAMAQLNHPNVVGVYDVELDEGEVSIAMEYVQGTTLREWLRTNPSHRAILEVFRQAGEGLAAAHRAGLVHRDFKPSNVLIAEDSRVKVTDFGLAKAWAAEARSSEASLDPGTAAESEAGLFTDMGTVMGTPRYMAPEQHSGEAASPATDQYAYCVALWEALAGIPPFSGDLAALFAAKLEGPPAWRGRALPNRIATAMARGLAPTPSDRWPSQQALLRALMDDPWTRRRRWLLPAVAALVPLGAFGAHRFLAGGAPPEPCTGADELIREDWSESHRARVEQAMAATDLPYARSTVEHVSNALDTYARAWSDNHRGICMATVRGEQSPQILDLRMDCMRRVRMQVSATVARFVSADRKVVENAASMVRSLPRLDHCDDLDRLHAERPPPHEPTLAEAVAAAERTLAEARSLALAGDPRRARDVIAGLSEDSALAHRPFLVSHQLLAAKVESDLGDWNAAADLYRSALTTALELDLREDVFAASSSLGFALGARLGRAEEGILLGELAVDMARGLAVPGPHLARAHIAVGGSNYVQGRLDAAERSLRMAMTEGDVLDPAGVRMSLAMVLTGQGHVAEAEAELRRAVQERDEELGAEHPDTALLRVALAFNLDQQGRNEEARGYLEQAIDVLDRTLGSDNLRSAQARSNLGTVLHRQGRYAEAEAEHRRALAIWEHNLGADNALLVGPLSQLAKLHASRGEIEQAHPLLERAWSIAEASSVGVYESATTAWWLAQVLTEKNVDPERARDLAQRAHDLLEGQNSPKAVDMRSEIASWLAAGPPVGGVPGREQPPPAGGGIAAAG